MTDCREPLLNPLRSECKKIETELALAENHTNVIDLHPQAVQRFKDNVENLAAIITATDATLDLALVASFLCWRNRMEQVVDTSNELVRIAPPASAGEPFWRAQRRPAR